ncbi:MULTISPECIES: elongation factor P [Anaerococcus]|jgi:translation elongation factor P|uniref:Elongation factor P n=1 Tax=Anaerococcus octavius TaxID=54007 RepID=A0A2I1M9L4_9FIRM|nr:MULTISPECIES: elongation factor P [Anaerococcus]MBS6105840.1 elongation factor P [Anaerococcus sp.]MDU2598168.1 elongation factor P [Anaerococcus sp.]MDU3177023.1 elongation factor P [Anaerococcus sp.]MDU4025508.1 elongation factor P [Anaerococcus sp.]MDU5229210.1 elongation factor P [Anaerococcus sp.]
MISANDLRKGVTFVYDNDVYQVVDFQHVKPGKGAAFVRAKIRSVMGGGTKDVTFNPNEKFENAVISTKEMQYLYNDGTLYYFMDPETFEQIGIEYEAVEEAIQYVKENDNVQIKFYEGKPFSVDAPNFVELVVTDTEPAIKGDTATNVTKPATVETGAVINVPVFVNEGDTIKIDTRTGDYLSRV